MFCLTSSVLERKTILHTSTFQPRMLAPFMPTEQAACQKRMRRANSDGTHPKSRLTSLIACPARPAHAVDAPCKQEESSERVRKNLPEPHHRRSAGVISSRPHRVTSASPIRNGAEFLPACAARGMAWAGAASPSVVRENPRVLRRPSRPIKIKVARNVRPMCGYPYRSDWLDGDQCMGDRIEKI
jgi:hypothetical protein